MATMNLNTDAAYAKLEAFRQQIMKIQGDLVNTENQSKVIFMQARRLVNMVLASQKQNAVIAAIQSSQNVILTGLSIQRVTADASAAFALGPSGIVQGILLSSIATGMAYNLVAAQQAQRQAKVQELYIQNVNEMREMYG